MLGKLSPRPLDSIEKICGGPWPALRQILGFTPDPVASPRQEPNGMGHRRFARFRSAVLMIWRISATTSSAGTVSP